MSENIDKIIEDVRKRRIADARREEGLRREEWARRQPAAAPGAVDALREAMMGVSESLCELEVQQEAIHVALAQQPPASGSRGVDEGES